MALESVSMPPTVMATAASPSAAASASSRAEPTSTQTTLRAVELPPPPHRTTYPKSAIPEPFPPAFPVVHLPPADPMAQDTVTISDAARKAATAADTASQSTATTTEGVAA